MHLTLQERAYRYFAPVRGAEYCDERVCVCLCLSVSVCPPAYLWNYTSNLHQVFCARLVCPWLSLFLVVLRYIMYTSGFIDDVLFAHDGQERVFSK